MTLDHNIPNLASFGTNLYRGGQPKDAAAWAYLRSLGVDRVIKLNTEPGDEEAEALGMDVQRFPISTPQQIWGPVGPQLEGALAAITTLCPIFVHCEVGENRTGTLVIYYRLVVCGWSKALAIAEAKKFEWEWSLPALQVFIDEQPDGTPH